MGTYQTAFGLAEYPEELIERIIRYRMRPYGITKPYPDPEEIAALEHLTPEDVSRILRATIIVWGH